MTNDSDLMTMWRKLFGSRDVTDETLVKAEALLKKFSPESPLRLRLAQELKEIRKLRAKN